MIDGRPPSAPPGVIARDRDDVDDILDGLRAFIDAEVVPRHRRRNDELVERAELYDTDGRYRPEVLALIREVREASARAGFYSMLVAGEEGTPQLGFDALYRVWQAIYHRCGTEFWLGHHTVAHWARGPSHLLTHLRPAVREQIMPDLMGGRTTTCFAMSEPDAGSDAWRMRTRAVRTADGWVLNGTKQWITNAPYAAYAVVFAVTDDAQAAQRRGGVTAFLVPTDAPGFVVDRVIRFFGHTGGDEGIISFTDVHVPDEHVLGEPGEGFRLAMQGVSTGRLYNSARSVGLAQWAIERAAAYASQRLTFGKPVIDNQGISFPLADRATEVHAAQLMGLNCARLLDSGAPARTELAMTKLFSTETAVRAVDTAMQAHGAMGFTNEVGLGEAWHQARRICVADGASEILRRQIARSLRGEA
ncbi:MAG TPA: acyl-CoA dehydrogenase [Candidatus Dormibacteraeota bacterium]|jgi:acyl-CoA dehydrogenase|nr:acyl-CoA dehydrogenase [Candidatus Dormibacteraeota bacterium]